MSDSFATPQLTRAGGPSSTNLGARASRSLAPSFPSIVRNVLEVLRRFIGGSIFLACSSPGHRGREWEIATKAVTILASAAALFTYGVG